MGRPKKGMSKNKNWTTRHEQALTRLYIKETNLPWHKRDRPLLLRIHKAISYLRKRHGKK